MSRPRVLVVDDKDSILSLFQRLLEGRYEVTTATDGAQALALIGAAEFDLVISDIRMPGADGLAVLGASKRAWPGTEVILMTAYASVQSAVEAMRQGAYDYLPKPFDPDEALVKIDRAVDHKRLRDHAEQLAREVRERYGFAQLIGKSPPMQRLFGLLEKAAGLDLTVLLTGESGTGKELAARAVHYASQRKDRRFVGVNCGALPLDLMESELFGHARGAFTGATADKRGLIEEAAGGTLFLDEVADLPAPLQVKLNRALQEREFRRVGDNADRRVEARIITATNQDLRARVADGAFREDLYYRLNVFPIHLPSLRERRADLPLLAAHFLGRIRERAGGRGPQGFAPDAVRALTSAPWPGNVRQLENAIERAFAVADGALIQVRDLPAEVTDAPAALGLLPREALARLPYRDAMQLAQRGATREYLIALLEATRGNVSRAAEQAGLARESLHRLLKRHGVDPESFR